MEQILVPFRGSGEGRDQPSWGQREVWGVGGHEGRHVTLGGVTPLPPGVTLRAIAESVSVLMARHPVLRTRFRVDGANRLAGQVLDARGEIPLRIVESDHPQQAALETSIAFDQNRFEVEGEWPLRMAVIRRRGELTHVVAVYNHIALDARGLGLLLAGLRGAAPGPGGPAGTQTAALQPLDQARWQGSTAGLRQSARALRHWRRVLEQAPYRQFSTMRDRAEAGEEPSYLRLVLASRAALLAARMIAERTRQGLGYILLAAFALAVARLSERTRVVLRVVVDNRFRRGLAESVGTVSQMGLWSVDVADAGFDGVLGRCVTASLDAYMNAYYDPLERQALVEEFVHEPGPRPIVFDCCYNDRRRAMPDERSAPVTLGEVYSALSRSRLRWEPWTAPTVPVGETLYLHVDDAPTGEGIEFTVCADPDYLSPADVEDCGRTIESVLVRAASAAGTAASTRISGLDLVH